MPTSCSAFGCTNRDTKETRGKGIKFYRIPVKKEKRQLWLSAINRPKDFDPPVGACICSEHFVGGKSNLQPLLLSATTTTTTTITTTIIVVLP